MPGPNTSSQDDDLEARLASFGQRMKELRVERGLSQERLAEAAGLHWSFVGRVERGQRNPNLKNILRIADGLGVEASELFRHANQAPASVR